MYTYIDLFGLIVVLTASRDCAPCVYSHMKVNHLLLVDMHSALSVLNIGVRYLLIISSLVLFTSNHENYD